MEATIMTSLSPDCGCGFRVGIFASMMIYCLYWDEEKLLCGVEKVWRQNKINKNSNRKFSVHIDRNRNWKVGQFGCQFWILWYSPEIENYYSLISSNKKKCRISPFTSIHVLWFLSNSIFIQIRSLRRGNEIRLLKIRSQILTFCLFPSLTLVIDMTMG